MTDDGTAFGSERSQGLSVLRQSAKQIVATDLTTGETRRRVLHSDGGVEANARLTGSSAAVLLVLLAAEGLTIPFIQSLLTAHVVIGMVLVPPVLVKLGSTGYRFFRYYTGKPAFVKKGPPPVLLRLLGPVVVVLTLALFGSGIALLFAAAPWRSDLVFLHKATFVLWFGVMTVHVLSHLGETLRLAPRLVRANQASSRRHQGPAVATRRERGAGHPAGDAARGKRSDLPRPRDRVRLRHTRSSVTARAVLVVAIV